VENLEDPRNIVLDTCPDFLCGSDVAFAKLLWPLVLFIDLSYVY